MKKSTSPLQTVAYALMAIGGLNWGLYGLGMLIERNLNVVNLLLGNWPAVEAIVYLLVGVATVVSLFGCMGSKKEME